jgi:hypothetical protein
MNKQIGRDCFNIETFRGDSLLWYRSDYYNKHGKSWVPVVIMKIGTHWIKGVDIHHPQESLVALFFTDLDSLCFGLSNFGLTLDDCYADNDIDTITAITRICETELDRLHNGPKWVGYAEQVSMDLSSYAKNVFQKFSRLLTGVRNDEILRLLQSVLAEAKRLK